jgi:hypothetical protein
MFWLNIPSIAITADTNDITSDYIFEAEESAGSAYLEFGLEWIKADAKVVFTWTGKSAAANTADPKTFNVSLNDIDTLKNSWTLIWCKLDATASSVATVGFNTSDATFGAGAWNNTGDLVISVADLNLAGHDAGFGTALAIDDYRQYTGIFDVSTVICSDEEFELGALI